MLGREFSVGGKVNGSLKSHDLKASREIEPAPSHERSASHIALKCLLCYDREVL